MEEDPDLFSFAETRSVPPPLTAPPVSAAKHEQPLTLPELRQAAFAFLVSLHPDGIAENVSTRRSKLCADAACFWRVSRSRNHAAIAQTALIVVNHDLDRCFNDCADRETQMAEITRMQRRRAELEAVIRETEPHLAASDDLFSEFRTWDYEASANIEYRRLRKALEEKIRQLCQGSRLERIRQAGVADLCFLAAPEGMIPPELVPPAWGLVEISRTGKRFHLVQNARLQENVTPAGRLVLTVNVAASAYRATRFAAGVDADATLRRVPRRRGKLPTGNAVTAEE